MEVIVTERLVLRLLTEDDAEFMLELVNDPDWLRHIGDRGVRNVGDSRNYLLHGPIAMYVNAGFGLYLVELREGRVPIGICGLIARDWLDDADLGFAFLPQFRSRGYAVEAAAATLEYARQTLGLRRIVAIVSPENTASISLLRKLGMEFEGRVRPPADAGELCLYGTVPTDPVGSHRTTRP